MSVKTVKTAGLEIAAATTHSGWKNGSLLGARTVIPPGNTAHCLHHSQVIRKAGKTHSVFVKKINQLTQNFYSFRKQQNTTKSQKYQITEGGKRTVASLLLRVLPQVVLFINWWPSSLRLLRRDRRQTRDDRCMVRS